MLNVVGVKITWQSIDELILKKKKTHVRADVNVSNYANERNNYLVIWMQKYDKDKQTKQNMLHAGSRYR